MEAKTVKVACHVPNGLTVCLFKQGFDDGTGVNPTVRDGDWVKLKGPASLHTGAGATSRPDAAPGIIEVNAEWFDKWWAQNQKNPMVEMKLIGKVEES